jgi:hypothetical protein
MTGGGGERLPEPPLVVLLHVPKTAGTTLAQLLRHHYRGGAFKGCGNVFARPDELEARLARIASTRRFRAAAGHLTFGLAERFLPGARYVTILREPVARTLSHYRFLVRSSRGQGLVPPRLPDPDPGLTLDRCLSRESYIPDNLQTRMLCGLASPYEELPSDALDRAKQTLAERVAFVGTTERFDELLAVLNLAFGWPTTPYERARASGGRPGGADVPPDVLRVAGERNALDRELWEHAGRLLDRQIAASGPAFADELAVLRLALERWTGSGPRAARPAGSELPLEARVELALKEAELVAAELDKRRLAVELKRERRMPVETRRGNVQP